MKLNIDKNVVEFIPENPGDKAKLEQLWRTVLDCAGGKNKTLSPIGEYVPSKDKKASFVIDGLDSDANTYTEIRVEFDCKVYCQKCNKLQDLKAGEPIPLCCGRIMEIID